MSDSSSPSAPAALLRELHASLDGRRRPEDVADVIGELIGPSLDRGDRATIERVASWSLRRRGYWSAMSDDFERPADGARQAASVAHLFDRQADVDPADPADLSRMVAEAGAEIAREPGQDDYKTDRLDRAARERAGLGGLSKRQYNRRFRALASLERKVARMARQVRLRELTLIGRSGFAASIPLDRFAADPTAAAFIAYYTARKNLRRQFSLSGRENPFDQIAAILLERCEEAPGTDWAMIALAHPSPGVLSRLDDTQRGELMGRWSALMSETASALGALWEAGDFDREKMVVHRGDDSSTWNGLAQAYNAARASWIGLLDASGALGLLDQRCPGKCLRLMAADLVYWHRSSDGELDPDTRVWAALPLPWDVLDGSVSSTRAEVEAICARLDVDPVARGWTGPRARGQIASFSPTPELVHGVAIADPAWAMLLRSAGAFSGNGGRPSRPERADEVISGLMGGVIVGDLPARGDG